MGSGFTSWTHCHIQVVYGRLAPKTIGIALAPDHWHWPPKSKTKGGLCFGFFFFFFFFFLLLNSVYTVLPLSQGLDIGLNGGTIHMKTVKYVHTKLCLSVYTEYY